MAPEGVDPASIPQHRLPTGALIPAIGLGTFGSDQVGAEEVAGAVRGAARVGYRHFDCAAVYHNEDRIGFALHAILAGGVRREDLWITSKLWNDSHSPEAVVPTCRKTLADLQLDYLDLYLVHWPFPNHHPPGCDVTARSPAAKPYIHTNYRATWREMERLVDLGLVRHIGTSNMTIPKLELLLADARIPPVVNQMELHPHFQQPELFAFLRGARHSSGRLFAHRIARTARARPHARGHGADGRPRDRVHRRAAGHSTGGGVRQVGHPARPDRRFRSPPIRGTTWPTCAGRPGAPLADEEMRAIAAH